MVIPWVKIVWISDAKGYGLVASQKIPKGTVTFVQDGLDIVIPADNLPNVDPRLIAYVDKYSYEDFMGNRIISWDFGKYMNHDDDSNTLTTGYGFEIAIRDINEGEEVTDDYRIFSTHHDTNFIKIPGTSNDVVPWPQELINFWNERVFSALQNIQPIEQPLKAFIQDELLKEVEELTSNPYSYRGIEESLPLRYRLQTPANPPSFSTSTNVNLKNS